ncbi:unnamed protein product, partial [Ixodes pacificus]
VHPAQHRLQKRGHLLQQTPVHHRLGDTLQALLEAPHPQPVVRSAHHHQSRHRLHLLPEVLDAVRPARQRVLSDDKQRRRGTVQQWVVHVTRPAQPDQRKREAHHGRHGLQQRHLAGYQPAGLPADQHDGPRAEARLQLVHLGPDRGHQVLRRLLLSGLGTGRFGRLNDDQLPKERELRGPRAPVESPRTQHEQRRSREPLRLVLTQERGRRVPGPSQESVERLRSRHHLVHQGRNARPQRLQDVEVGGEIRRARLLDDEGVQPLEQPRVPAVRAEQTPHPARRPVHGKAPQHGFVGVPLVCEPREAVCVQQTHDPRHKLPLSVAPARSLGLPVPVVGSGLAPRPRTRVALALTHQAADAAAVVGQRAGRRPGLDVDGRVFGGDCRAAGARDVFHEKELGGSGVVGVGVGVPRAGVAVVHAHDVRLFFLAGEVLEVGLGADGTVAGCAHPVLGPRRASKVSSAYLTLLRVVTPASEGWATGCLHRHWISNRRGTHEAGTTYLAFRPRPRQSTTVYSACRR